MSPHNASHSAVRGPCLLPLPAAARSVSELLERRREQQERYDAGEVPHFLPETKKARGWVGWDGRGVGGVARLGWPGCGGWGGPAVVAWLGFATIDVCQCLQSARSPLHPHCPPPHPNPLDCGMPWPGQVREGDWRVAPLPADFQDRRVEITGPTDRKMVINALNRCHQWALTALCPPCLPGIPCLLCLLCLLAGGAGCALPAAG